MICYDLGMDNPRCFCAFYACLTRSYSASSNRVHVHSFFVKQRVPMYSVQSAMITQLNVLPFCVSQAFSPSTIYGYHISSLHNYIHMRSDRHHSHAYSI